MTRMTGPDCAVMCILINTHTHTGIYIYIYIFLRSIWSHSHLFPPQVTKMILHRSDSGFWLLSAAIETGTVAMFKAVMGTVSHKLTEAEVRHFTVGEGA